jgi:hypothetical protein
MYGTSGLGTAVIVLVVVACLAGLCLIAASVAKRVANQLPDDVSSRSSTTPGEQVVHNEPEERSTSARNRMDDRASPSDH